MTNSDTPPDRMEKPFIFREIYIVGDGLMLGALLYALIFFVISGISLIFEGMTSSKQIFSAVFFVVLILLATPFVWVAVKLIPREDPELRISNYHFYVSGITLLVSLSLLGVSAFLWGFDWIRYEVSIITMGTLITGVVIRGLILRYYKRAG